MLAAAVETVARSRGGGGGSHYNDLNCYISSVFPSSPGFLKQRLTRSSAETFRCLRQCLALFLVWAVSAQRDPRQVEVRSHHLTGVLA